jgi:high-affinity Fe2+/Pb2+ permease
MILGIIIGAAIAIVAGIFLIRYFIHKYFNG